MKYRFFQKVLLLVMFVFLGDGLVAQIPNGYYNGASGKTGDELKIALHNIIKNHHVVSYGGLINAFAYTDCKPNGKIWDIYSNCEYVTTEGLCGDYEQEGDCWNREHTWPQSWFNEQNGPRSDLFHVYPTDGYVNGRRSNYPYGEVNKPTYTSGNGSKLGPCVTSGYSGTVFEPIDEYKGDIARGLFYLSVRYYEEDEDWAVSNMTNKSVIKDWAMTMLLRWSDEDPVSQKEIDRNNAVYGYQNNRNPFIDHPEYAHMIWDEGWVGTSYNITCATGLSHGSITAPETALEGSAVTITAIPQAGYMVGTWSVYKTGNQNVTVSVSEDGTFIMPKFDVTVSATFVQNNTLYTISLGAVNHGYISASANQAKSGTNITLTATPDSGYSLYSWYVFKTGDMNTTVGVSGNSFVMPAFDVTVMATFVQGGSSNYVKLDTAPTDWSGEYLIVCENRGVAFNGTIDNNWGRCSNVSISNGTIGSNVTTDSYKVVIAPYSSGYKIQFPDGKYMNWTTEKKFSEGVTPAAYSLSVSGGNILISYGDCQLQYNYNSGNGGLRSYKTNQTPIQLYKKITTTPTPTHTIYFNPNGASGMMPSQTVEEFVQTSLNPNVFVRQGYVFDGWNTAPDGSGDYYVDECVVSLLSDLELYAQWEKIYSITMVDGVEHGSISASVEEAIEGTCITLTANPDLGYELDQWIVMDGEGHFVMVSDNQFVMPVSDVTVSAAFAYVGQFVQQYHRITSTDQLISGRTYLIVNTTNRRALGKTQNQNNRSSVAMTIVNYTISELGDACELVLGKTGNNWTFFDAGWGTNGGYLYAASSGSNSLKTQATNNNDGMWSITFNNQGMASIVAQGSNTRNHLRYNSNGGTPIFSCYANTSTLPLVELYIRGEEYEIMEDTTVANLFAFDKYVIRSGNILSVVGEATCTDATHLIIEDGAQFVHHNGGVQAMFKKNVLAYSNGENGWYTLSFPMTSVAPSLSMCDAEYDLYSYDEDGMKEWVNYKADAFDLTSGMGCLYAHYPHTTLRISGVLNDGDYCQTIPLSYANAHESIKGFNLMGNPTAHDITFNTTDGVSGGYYWVENGSAWIYEPSNIVPAGRGFLVKANAEGQSVCLNTDSNAKKNDGSICLSIGKDKVYVLMGKGDGMPLLGLNKKQVPFYFTQAGTAFVMLSNDKCNYMDLVYEARFNGQQTIHLDMQGLTVDFLHLFDRLTGKDIDLLCTPSYTFETQVGDNPSRFQLRFVPTADPSN